MDHMKGTSHPNSRKTQTQLESEVKMVAKVSHDDIEVWEPNRYR